MLRKSYIISSFHAGHATRRAGSWQCLISFALCQPDDYVIFGVFLLFLLLALFAYAFRLANWHRRRTHNLDLLSSAKLIAIGFSGIAVCCVRDIVPILIIIQQQTKYKYKSNERFCDVTGMRQNHHIKRMLARHRNTILSDTSRALVLPLLLR